jgi:hypothetical protein
MARSRRPEPTRPLPAVPRVLFVILACYLVIAIAYSLATRLRWGPDEPGHIAYIESLALDGRFPALGAADIYRPGAAISHQVQHPPLYYLAAAAVYRAARLLPEDGRIRVLRAFSALLGVLSLWLLWLLTGLTFPGRSAARLAAVALLAFLPMFGYMSGVVNNDALVLPLCLGTLYVTGTIVVGDRALRRHLLAGLLAGLAVFTKEVALALLPVTLVAVMVPRRDDGLPLRRRLAGAALIAVVALAIPAVWWARNLVVSGHPVVYAYVKPPFQSLGELLATPGVAAHIALVWARLSFITLWAPFWAMKGVISLPAYTGVTASVTAIVCLGLVLLLRDQMRRAKPLAATQVRLVALTLAFPCLVAAGVLRYTLFVDFRTVEGGRYILVAWPCLAVLITAALEHIAGRFRTVILAVAVGLWLMGDLTVLWAVGRTYGVW